MAPDVLSPLLLPSSERKLNVPAEYNRAWPQAGLGHPSCAGEPPSPKDPVAWAILEALINPRMPISDGAFAKHDISDAMLRGKPTFRTFAPQLLHFLLQPGTWFVAHNAAFDIDVLNRELKRVAARMIIPANRAICTLQMSASFVDRCDLDSVCDALGIDRSRRLKHRAGLDAQLCAEVLRTLTFGARTKMRSVA